MSGRRYYAGRDVRRALNIDELSGIARRWLPRFAWEYLDGGAEDETSLRRNRSSFERVSFLPRTLVDVAARDLSTELFGQRLGLPLIIGPSALNALLRHGADFALARAAATHRIPFALSTLGTASIEDICERVGGVIWFQLYNMKNREFWRRLVERANAAGCQALVVTTDVPVYGNREWDARNYTATARLSLRSKLDVLAHVPWLVNVMLSQGQPRFANLSEVLPRGDTRAIKGARYLTDQLDATFTWEDVRLLRDLWPRALVIKGILSVEDADRACQIGADAVVLSNHGGRQLDGAVAPLEILPEVVRAVGDRTNVLIDSGFRRGADVAKALALGAKAVMIGRATLYGVAAGGEAGAAHALDILRSEIDRVVALLGCTAIKELRRQHLHFSMDTASTGGVG